MNKKNHLGWNMRSRDLFARAFLKAGGNLYMLGRLFGVTNLANLHKRYGVHSPVDVEVVYSDKQQTPEEMREILRLLVKGTQERFRRIYTTLVKYAGADPNEYDDFEGFMWDGGSDEYRFQGSIGFGGKYWKSRNRVTGYPEDTTDKVREIISDTNRALKEKL